uniref:Reverse transcriptase domain-containing protein n=1 Tax=Dicentrarchus labrax TaxID=13489 RepID=A0A8P4KAC5_DICLA
MALANLLDTKVQGALVRSRVQNITEMDAPSSFFFGLEKKQGQRRQIHSLLSETGQELTEPGLIRKRAVEFYASLFESEFKENEELMEEVCGGLPQISREANQQLDSPLTPQELYAALQSMQGRKAPGIDGLTVEFYKAFWDILAHDIIDVFNESLVSGSLPLSCRRAIITLLPKKGNLQEIRNWRPVSLLCTDYKILSKVLANRLKGTMEQILHRDQTYCVPGRSMVDNIYLIRDVLEVSSSLGINTGLISLDQEKAFDRVEHDFLWKVMERFGFSAGLIAKIKVLYSDIESVLKFNGGLCAPFRVHRGVRQGCALSGMLYALSLEPLLQKIRSSVRGLFLPGFNSSVVLSAYADDVVVFIKDQQDVCVLNSVIQKFSVVSAARVNWRKSEALAVGEWREGLPVLPQSLIWRREGLKYLGIYLGNSDIGKKNWENILEKVDNKLAKWRWLHPQISFRGRVLILNNLVASMLWHRLACLDPPTGLIAQIQVNIVNFFWNKLHWIPQSVLFLSRDEGGQGLVHLASRTATFRLQFIQKYLTGPEDLVWRDVASCILRRVNNLGLDAALFLTDFKFLKLGGLPPFYQGVFKSWGLFKCKRSEKCNSLHWLLKEPIICGAKMDVCCSTVPGLMGVLCSSRVVCLKQLIDAAGPELTDVQSLGSVLGVRSVRLMQRSLELWRRRLTEKERILLLKYGRGEAEPDPTDPYPEIYLCPGFTELSGPLLRHNDGRTLSLHKADKKTLYTNCVKTIHKTRLCDRAQCVWTERLGGLSPQWRTLYKPPLKKRTGDLQWRILHGAIATNAFLSVLNHSVVKECPFCGLTENIFHVFTECRRLADIFNVLTRVFNLFGVIFTAPVFICGVGFKKTEKVKCRLLNFLIGEAKMSIYLTRRDRLQGGPTLDPVTLWRYNVKARLRLEFCFHRVTGNTDVFEQQWAHEELLCRVTGGELKFTSFLN